MNRETGPANSRTNSTLSGVRMVCSRRTLVDLRTVRRFNSGGFSFPDH